MLSRPRRAANVSRVTDAALTFVQSWYRVRDKEQEEHHKTKRLLVHPTRNSGGVSLAGSPRTKERVSPRCSKPRLSTIASNGPKCDSLLGPATSGGPRSILALSPRLAQAALRSTSEGRCPLQTSRGDTDTSKSRGWLHANHAAGDKPRPLYL